MQINFNTQFCTECQNNDTKSDTKLWLNQNQMQFIQYCKQRKEQHLLETSMKIVTIAGYSQL